MIPLGVPGGKSGVVIVVRAQDGLEVCCPCSLPLFESNKFMPKFQLDLGHSKKRAPLCIHYQKIICHHYHLIIVIIIMLYYKLSFNANFSSFSLAESLTHDLQKAA